MLCCYQTPGQSVFAHGDRVCCYLFDLIHLIRGEKPDYEWKLPIWVQEYGKRLLALLPDDDTLIEYAYYHDCGKPYCRTVDENGQQHFPDHARKSAEVWEAVGGSLEATKLIGMDMDFHCLKADGVEEFASRPEAVTLMLTALAEIHANAQMFGGIESTGFKIKWKHIEKRGKQVCEVMFGKGRPKTAISIK